MSTTAEQTVLKRMIQYAFAAFIAVIINIGSQWLVIAAFGSSARVVYASVLLGTFTGLVAKYGMDKYLIFRDNSVGAQAVSQIGLYVFTGIITTFVFWGVELAFHYIFQSDTMRYLGGVVGLSIGYAIKFVLDSRYVFRAQR